MKLKQLFTAITAFFSAGSLAQGDLAPKYSHEFLQIGVGANALGMSNATIAGASDVTAGYWNPAGLTDVKEWMQIGAMHA